MTALESKPPSNTGLSQDSRVLGKIPGECRAIQESRLRGSGGSLFVRLFYQFDAWLVQEYECKVGLVGTFFLRLRVLRALFVKGTSHTLKRSSWDEQEVKSFACETYETSKNQCLDT